MPKKFEIKIECTKITIVQRSGHMDNVVIHTNLPTTCPGPNYDVSFLVHAQYGYGETWVKNNFPNAEIEIVRN